MTDEATKTCIECQGLMSPIIIMDRFHRESYGPSPYSLSYRRPEDSRSFWTGKFPTAGTVRAFLCGECGRIAIYGDVSDAQP
ncbi:MAG: hypothetical protein EXS05_04070 [Planctomycetaceae bacterium]|nr:hypothetical protein [Planctomycetaceae bacterium]